MTKKNHIVKIVGIIIFLSVIISGCKLFKKDCDCPKWSELPKETKDSFEEKA